MVGNYPLYLGTASTRRFLFLMMPRRRDYARSVIESRGDLNRVKSWAFALWSMAEDAPAGS